MKVIGLDPGTLKMGYGILVLKSNKIECLDCSTLVFSPKKSLGSRLDEMDQQLSCLFKKYKPEHTAIEKMFLGKNPDSAFKLGQAFGIGLCQAHRWSSQVFEYSSRTIKKSVVGSGSAGKESIRLWMNRFFKMKINSLDASDALAVALCHIYHNQAQKILKLTE